MDTPPFSTSDVHSIKQQQQEEKKEKEEEEEVPTITSNSLPYHSLLLQLHTLIDLQQNIWTIDFQFAPFTWEDIWTLQQDVKMLQLIFMLLLKYGVRSRYLHDIQTMAEIEAGRIQMLVAALPDNQDFEDIMRYSFKWDSRVNKFLKKLHKKIKPHLKEVCVEIIDRLLQGNCCTTMDYGVFTFIDVILLKLKHFKKLKPNLFDPWKKQMQILEQMLNYAPIIARKLKNLDENLQNFLEFFESWVNTAAAIVIPYWIDESDEKAFSRVSPSLQKFNLNILEYVEAYILVIKALRPSDASEILVMRNTVEQFIEMIMEKFVVSMDDRFDIFREGLGFWTALLVDPPKSDAEHEKLICSQTHLLVDQAKSFICSMCLKKLGKDVAESKNALLNHFLQKINEAKAEVKQLQVHQIPGLSWSYSLKENTRGRFDLLLENLQKKFEVEVGFLPFEKHLIVTVYEQLSLLRPFLLDNFKLQDEHEELRNIWLQASYIACSVDCVIDFCLASADIPIWSNLMHLSNAIEKLQSITNQVSKIRQDDQMYNNILMSAKLNSQEVLPARQEVYDATINVDFKVGFVEEEQKIIDFLVAREARLHIVAIVGMGGQGKTHLARRVFQDKRIKHHFYKLAWCCISQEYDNKKVFRDILEGVGETVSLDLYQTLTQEDLADKLRKSLMGQKYLIVLDDLWDAKAWFDFQESFPDVDGSRILLTSRNLDVALKVKANCSIVKLNPLSSEESWYLLKMKIFHRDYCPRILSKIGKAVAENCKGLPLAVVVVAGLLKKGTNVKSWKKFCESLEPLIASEGCMDIVELSYKHLPDYLKPCFLYLGVFKEDELIYANDLIKFWMAEGFVQSNGIKTREVVANEYLMDLASRNLIFVSERSSRNGIKRFSVHDLLHQLCLVKAEEERFLLVLNDMYGGCSTLYNKHYRISLHDKWEPFVDSKPIVPCLRSLLVSVESSVDVSGLLKEFKLIRILNLASVVITKASFHYITQLIHLRLLVVDCGFPIPPSILNLWKLEVLCNTNGRVILPSVVTRMPSLRHIFAEVFEFDCTDFYDQLVPDMSSFPLTNLETLATVSFDDILSFKMVAKSLQNVVKLGSKCWFCFHLSSYFRRLESLKLHIVSDWRQQEEVISPSTLDFPSTLKKLNLTGSKQLSDAMISLIGKLHNLEVLKLEANFENGTWNVEDDEFLRLKYLSLRFSSVQEWNVYDESFPCLQQLLIRTCRKLGELPARFGSVTTLRRIEVKDCGDSLSNSFQRIIDDQMDVGNEGLQYSIS